MSKSSATAKRSSAKFAAMTAPRPTANLRVAQGTVPDHASHEKKPAADNAMIAARNIRKSYQKGSLTIPVLRGVDFSVHAGQFHAIIGQSGSGKSTLLHILGTLDQPDKGEVRFDGKRIDNLPTSKRDHLRNQQIGMIFQFYHLLPELTTLENVMSPVMIAKGLWQYWRCKTAIRERAEHLLDMVGLSHRLNHKPRELSGGEMQRAAIARSLITSPSVLLADEPTGNLDRKNGDEILSILRTLNAEENLTIVMVTHDQAIAAEADGAVRLVEGRVETV